MNCLLIHLGLLAELTTTITYIYVYTGIVILFTTQDPRFFKWYLGCALKVVLKRV